MERRIFLGSALSAAAAPVGIAGKIRVGMLGTKHGHYSGKLKAVQTSPDYEYVATVEFDRADKVLNDASIHLIVVECAAWEAIPWGKKAVAAGKHLHLEKPPGNEWAPFKELVEEARSKKLLLQTGYLWRFHQGVMAAIDAAKAGWLGEILMVRATMSADRDDAQRAVEAKYKGGGLFELGGHVIDRTVELLGRPKSVKSWLKHGTSVPDKLADNNVAVFEYDKALAVITQSAKMAGAGEHRSFEVIGTDGTFLVYPEANPPRMHVHLRKAQGKYKAGWQQVDLPPQPRFIADFAELARALKFGQPLKHSYDHELLLHETLLRASGEIA
jgi:predicted dehydrogenase